MAVFCAALVATLILAAWLTPHGWWRRPNARALAVLVVGTVGIGSGLLRLFDAPPAHAAQLANAAGALGSSYRAYDDLNLRTGTGVSARRVAVVPAGAAVTPTGVRSGDWWEVSVRVDGRAQRGWVSSLWLRKQNEARR
ncbi:MAG: SH3 domain-containing protein [Massilia sp.]